jgi:nucleotide-binding universal stress UspA family protein
MTTARKRPARIVVGVDGSEGCKLALRWAAHLAPRLGARIEAVTAWDIPVAYGWALPNWNPQHDAEQLLRATIDEVFAKNRPADLIMCAREGGAAHVLVEASQGAALLIVGSRGHGGFVGLLLGSVSTSVAEHATCPVLVVHGDQLPGK